MKYAFLNSIALFIAISGTAFSQQKKFSKEETIALYNKLYKTSMIDSMSLQKKGHCDCGKIENGIYQKAENRINFFRLVSGLPTVKVNVNFNPEAQCAAFIVKENNQLTHYPSKEMKCYTEMAANGCAKSCLGFSDFKHSKDVSFITHFIRDYGESNNDVGHRRWVLYTKLKAFGYGATHGSEAVLVVDGVSKTETNFTIDYTAYPWNGFVPIDLIFPKWSFSIPEDQKVNFTKATITVTDPAGKSIELRKLPYEKFLDHTLVWSMTGLFSNADIKTGTNHLEKNGFLGTRLKVSIKNVEINGVLKDFEYFVESIKV